MDLRSRLAGLGSPMKGPGPARVVAPPLILGEVAPASPRPGPSAPQRLDVSHLLSPIPPTETPAGKAYLLEGAVLPLPPLLPATLTALALSRPFTSTEVERPLFLDTETTGLAGGTGTVAFLVGLAAQREGLLSVQQAFLPGHVDERPMLEWLRGRVEAATLLITFNGKSFDWPLLKSRYVMNRLPPPPERPHVDLLHVARRVFRHHVLHARQQALEAAVLGVVRQGDIDGAEIPDAWFDWLRTGRVANVMRVVEHNALDLVGMARLLGELVDLWEARHEPHPAVALGLTELARRCADDERALRFARRAAESESPTLRGLALEQLGHLLKRAGDGAGAARALTEALALRGDAPHLHVALSKLYEHQLGSVAAARHHALRGAGGEPERDRRRRLARLQAGQGELGLSGPSSSTARSAPSA